MRRRKLTQSSQHGCCCSTIGTLDELERPDQGFRSLLPGRPRPLCKRLFEVRDSEHAHSLKCEYKLILTNVVGPDWRNGRNFLQVMNSIFTRSSQVLTQRSGTNAVRYGTMKDWVINLTVVLSDGTVIKTRRRPRCARPLFQP